MSDAVVRRESAAEYFKELVEGALAHQRIAAGELTSFYVVNLLTGFLQRPAEEDQTPLAFRLAEALDAAGMRQRANLKQIGDLSLFVSGFFADSLPRKLVDVDYYVSIGGTAYTALSRYETDAFSPYLRSSPRTSCGSWTSFRRSANAPRCARTPTCCVCTSDGSRPAAAVARTCSRSVGSCRISPPKTTASNSAAVSRSFRRTGSTHTSAISPHLHVYVGGHFPRRDRTLQPVPASNGISDLNDWSI